MYKMTADPAKAPNTPSRISLTFKHGVPVKVENKDDGNVVADPLELFLYLNKIA